MNNKVNIIVDKYKEDLKSLNAVIYQRTKEEDILLIKLWMSLVESSEIDGLITKPSRTPATFMDLFKEPTFLLYGIGSKGIDLAYWIKPVASNVEHPIADCGYWVSKETRGTKRSIQFTFTAYSLAFEFFEALLGITWQSDLLKIHQKLGYKTVGVVPWLNDEPFSYIEHLTREDFFASRFVKVAQRSL